MRFRAEIYRNGWRDLLDIALGALIGIVYTILVLVLISQVH